ncbi:hypothetical protein MKW98_012639 [Papaver atlanticum]|uniref:Uncharacterized protein n=1 Tax=Papaver atlanticum TaxID=357466 RepID=A0AAD4T256_9MAGN|nr:hypothetical protein MKW98_012639 [Papaver atlanticum]
MFSFTTIYPPPPPPPESTPSSFLLDQDLLGLVPSYLSLSKSKEALQGKRLVGTPSEEKWPRVGALKDWHEHINDGSHST